MVNYSIGVRLAWEISSYEAANKKSPHIEVDHIMLGILSLDKIQDNFKLKSEFEQLTYEKDKLYNTLKTFNINTTLTRRKLRELLPCGVGLPVDNVFHRSNDCKKIFRDASLLANNFLSINNLFQTIITWELSYMRTLLIAENVDIDKLKAEIMFSFYRKN